MATPEAFTKNAVTAVLQHAKDSTGAMRPIVWTMPTPGAADTGSPDFWILAAGRLILVEAKADKSEGGRDARPAQVKFMETWSAAGATTFVVKDETSFEAFKLWLSTFLALPAPAQVPWRSEVVKSRAPAPPIPRAKRAPKE